MRTLGPHLSDFERQNRFAAVSIGPAELGDLRAYIGGQREYHRRISFRDEYRALLAQHEMEFVEHYIWD